MSIPRKFLDSSLLFGQASGKKKAACCGCILLIIILAAGGFAGVKPDVVMDNSQPGIFVQNQGRVDALVHRVEGFWYWGGHVALLENLPDIRQKIKKNDSSVKLDIPDIPSPRVLGIKEKVCYMKLSIQYIMPGIPIFRFATNVYFKYDENGEAWLPVESIPPKHRAIGNLAIGNVDKIDLNFN